MANGNTAKEFGLNRTDIRILVRALDGKSDAEIANEVFGKSMTTQEYDKKRRKVKATMRKPGFAEAFHELIREQANEDVVKCLKRLRDQRDNEEGWLANKATNDLLNRMWSVVMGNTDNAVTIKIEGMPQLGTPDSEE